MTTYTVTAVREGEWWTLDASDVDGAYGQVGSLAEAEAAARDILALALDCEPDDIDVVVTPVLDEKTRAALAEAERLTGLADEYRERASRTRKEAISEYVQRGHLPYREAAKALGISSQRVHQLVGAPPSN